MEIELCKITHLPTARATNEPPTTKPGPNPVPPTCALCGMTRAHASFQKNLPVIPREMSASLSKPPTLKICNDCPTLQSICDSWQWKSRCAWSMSSKTPRARRRRPTPRIAHLCVDTWMVGSSASAFEESCMAHETLLLEGGGDYNNAPRHDLCCTFTA